MIINRRAILGSGMLALLLPGSSGAVAMGLTSYASPLQGGPYFMGTLSVPNPVHPNDVTLSGQSKVESSEEIPADNRTEGNLSILERTSH
jgi:hypothetical protein